MSAVAPIAGVTAFVLAGGLDASRRPEAVEGPMVEGPTVEGPTAEGPGALAEVLGRPFVFHILDRLAELGLREVVLCSGGRTAGMLRAVVGASYRDMTIRHSVEDRPLGGGGALALALSRRPSSLALVLDGDVLVAADFAAFLRWGESAGGLASLLLPEAADAGPFGGVEPAAAGRIAGFAAKGRIPAGVFLLRPGALAGVRPGAAASLEGDVFPRLAAAGELRGFRTPGAALGLDTPEARVAAGRLLAGLPEGPGSRAAVFLDRDGTVIEERHYLSDPAGVALLPGAAEGLARLRGLGLPLVLVTNQSGVGRGYFGRDAMERVHGRLIGLLAECGVRLSAIYSCPHAPEDGCGCRKPRPGLLLRAAAELGLDLPRCFVVGDKPCDIELGRNVGATAVLVRTGYGAGCVEAGDCAAQFVAADLADAAADIAACLRRRAGGGAG